MIFTGNCDGIYHTQQLAMTADAVFLNYSNAGLFDFDHLRFSPGSENGCMPQSVAGLKIIGSEKVVLWNMTIVAGSYLAVAAVCP
jgi:hypothetical protein